MSADPRTVQTEPPRRRTIPTPLSGTTLEERDLRTDGAYGPPIRVLPDVNVIKVGGQSFFDRGLAAAAVSKPTVA